MAISGERQSEISLNILCYLATHPERIETLLMSSRSMDSVNELVAEIRIGADEALDFFEILDQRLRERGLETAS